MQEKEEFFSYLNSLDDSYYFFIASTVLGKAPVPFHKPVVNSSVLSFLLNEENRHSILISLSKEDRQYLSFVRIIGRCRASGCASFFTDRTYPVVLSGLESLRDRLVLLKRDRQYFINPVLMSVADKAFDADLIFGENVSAKGPEPIVDRNVLFAIINLLSNGSVPARDANEHHFTKSGRLSQVFPSFSADDSLIFYHSLKKLLLRTAVLRISGGRFLPQREREADVSALDPLNLMIQAIGEEYASAVTGLLSVLAVHSVAENGAQVLLGLFSEGKDCAGVLRTMAAFGFVIIENGIVMLNPAVNETGIEMSDLRVDSDMEVSYYGLPSQTDILHLFSDVKVCDKLVRYAITKDSFIRSLALGLTGKDVASYLGTDRFDSAFSQWEASFSRIRLYDGMVIRCDPSVASVVRQHPDLAQHIVEDLGNGIFVMRRSTFPVWEASLAYALDIKSLPLAQNGEKASLSSSEGFALHSVPEIRTEETSPSDEEEKEILRKRLLDDAKTKGCLTDDVKALIEQGLIISPSQIGKGFRYASMQTIGGFDYNAKLSALRGVLKKANGAEAPFLKLELSDESMVVQPVDLLKNDKGDAVLKVRVLPDCEERIISVSSVFEITVMRWSLS